MTFIALLGAIMSTVCVQASELSTDNILTINETAAPTGSQVVLPINMTNQANITGFQFDLYLPESIKIAESDNELMIDLDESRSTYKKHSISYATQANGALRVVCTSMTNAVFSGNDGPVINITLNLPEYVDQSQITISKIELTTPNADVIRPNESQAMVTVYKNGDANLDNVIDVADVTTVAKYILGETPVIFFVPAADANNDGVIDIADITKIASMILGK